MPVDFVSHDKKEFPFQIKYFRFNCNRDDL